MGELAQSLPESARILCQDSGDLKVRGRAKLARRHVGKRIRINNKTGEDLYGAIGQGMQIVHQDEFGLHKSLVTFAPLILLR